MIAETLAFKLIAAPTLITVVTLAGRRWGQSTAGLLAALPLTSAPVMVFVALEQGPAFAAEASLSALLGVASFAMFCLIYGALAERYDWIVSTAAGWAAYAIVTSVLHPMRFTLAGAGLLAAAVLVATNATFPKVQRAAQAAPIHAWDLPLRIALAVVLVLGLTGLARLMGPRLSGLLTPFPVYGTIFAVFAHRADGAAAALRFLRALLAGSYAFALFFAVLASSLLTRGLLAAFGTAAASALLLQGVLLARSRAGRPHRA